MSDQQQKEETSASDAVRTPKPASPAATETMPPPATTGVLGRFGLIVFLLGAGCAITWPHHGSLLPVAALMKLGVLVGLDNAEVILGASQKGGPSHENEFRAPPGKFKVGDVVEQVYNTNTGKNRVLFPFRVEVVHADHLVPDGEGGHRPQNCSASEKEDGDESSERPSCDALDAQYTIVRLLDGNRVERISESLLRTYMPYGRDSQALCNIGGFGMGKERLEPCTVVDYSLGKAEYRVVAAESERNLPMGKLFRKS